MEGRHTRMLLGAGGVLVAIGAVVYFTRESATPIVSVDGGGVDASASANASANANADADANAMATADADSGTDAEVAPTASATATARKDAGPALETGRVDAGAAAAEGGAKEARVVNLDENGAGKTIDLAVGQSLVLLLTANPTSGFDWAVIKSPTALGAPAMGFISGGDQMGAPGKRRITWTLKTALPEGVHLVELGYARSFEPGVAPFKTFRFKVRPKP